MCTSSYSSVFLWPLLLHCVFSCSICFHIIIVLASSQTDVIVNTASSDRNLKMGQVSNALLSKAGDRMQDEILKAPSGQQVVITSAYKLRCKEVFHTFCSFHNQQTAAHKVDYNMKSCVSFS